MVRLEVGETGRGRADRGHRGLLSGIQPAGRTDFIDCLFDMGIRPVSNACSGKLGEVTDDEVNGHLGNPVTNKLGVLTPSHRLEKSWQAHGSLLLETRTRVSLRS